MIDSPKLRFKDFKLDIEYKELKEFISLIQSGLSRQLRDEDIGLPVLRSNNLQDNSIDIKDIKYWYLNDPQGANTSNYFLEKNDLLVNFINSISQIGKSAIYQNELNRNTILTTNIFRLRFNKLINPLYIGYFFQTKKYFDYIQSITKPAINQASFTTKEFQKLLVPYVSIEEQTKIANFLKAVDKKISQLNEQLQLMIQYKKGVMQKIFSQEIRFKDDNGEEFEKWKECTLSQLAYSYTGLSGKNKDDFGSGFAYITYKQIFDNRKIDLSKVEFVEISNDEKQNQVKKNDLFFTTSSETPEEVAFCSVLLDEFNSPIYLNSFCFGVRPKNQNELNSVYASFYFKSDSFRKKILHLAQGSTRYNISKKEFMEIDFLLPCVGEQVKIANYLSALDQHIEILAKQIEHAKAWKKGLLQQMFV